MLNHLNAEDTQTLKGTADLTMLLPKNKRVAKIHNVHD